MENYVAELALLADLDERHDDLLERLDELDKRIEGVLQRWQGGCMPAGLANSIESAQKNLALTG